MAQGEWKVRTHGYTKRRTWRKLHLFVNETTNEIIVSGASGNNVSDDEMFVGMIDQTNEEIDQISRERSFIYSAVFG